MNTWSLRLNDALKARNKTVTDLSRATRVSWPGVKKWIDGRVSQPIEFCFDHEGNAHVMGELIKTQW